MSLLDSRCGSPILDTRAAAGWPESRPRPHRRPHRPQPPPPPPPPLFAPGNSTPTFGLAPPAQPRGPARTAAPTAPIPPPPPPFRFASRQLQPILEVSPLRRIAWTAAHDPLRPR